MKGWQTDILCECGIHGKEGVVRGGIKGLSNRRIFIKKVMTVDSSYSVKDYHKYITYIYYYYNEGYNIHI